MTEGTERTELEAAYLAAADAGIMTIPPGATVDAYGIFAALLDAQRHADAITKSGRNTSQGWAFVTVEEVTRVAREALNKAGLVAFLRVLTPYDPQMLDAVLVLVHPMSGQEALFSVPWPVDRPGPQARRAAYAYARKQALLELLALSESDPETTAVPEPASRPAKRVRVALTPKEATEIQEGARRLQSGQKDSAGVASVTGVDPMGGATGAEGINTPMVPAEPSKRSKPSAAPVTRDTPAPGMATRPMVLAIHAKITELEYAKGKLTDEQRRALIATAAGRAEPLESTYDLTFEEARQVFDYLEAKAKE